MPPFCKTLYVKTHIIKKYTENPLYSLIGCPDCEALMFRKAISVARKWILQNVVIEGDAQMVVDAINL